MQLEEAKRNIKNRLDDIKEYIEYGMPYSDYLELQTSFETVLKYIDNSIPKQVVIEKLDNLELDSELQDSWDELSGCTAVTLAYKELLKGR